jgi:hypothetical protein
MRRDYTGNEFRTDGFYYQKFTSDSYNVIFFYKNGLTLSGGVFGQNLEELNEKILISNWEQLEEVPIGLGVFKIEGDIIDYEFWANHDSGCYIPVVYSGEVLNDENLSFDHEDYNNMFFEQSSFKPDSTNQWIE